MEYIERPMSSSGPLLNDNVMYVSFIKYLDIILNLIQSVFFGEPKLYKNWDKRKYDIIT